MNKTNPYNLIGSNILSNYGGGNEENWAKADGRPAIKDHNAFFHYQDYADNKLEIFGARTVFDLIAVKFLKYG